MLKKLGYAARKLILITTLMALVATVASCGSDDESATGSRTRNFSPSLDCEEEPTIPDGSDMASPPTSTPLAETQEQAEINAREALLNEEAAREKALIAEEAATAAAEEEENLRIAAIQEAKQAAEEEAEAAELRAQEERAERERQEIMESQQRWMNQVFEQEQREKERAERNHQAMMESQQRWMNQMYEQEQREREAKAAELRAQEERAERNHQAMMESQQRWMNQMYEQEQREREAEAARVALQQAESVSQETTAHVITAFSDTVKNSSADAQTNACEALQNDINAQNVESEAQTKLDEKKSDLSFLNDMINALDPENTEEEQTALTENSEKARNQAAEAAAQLSDFEQVADASAKFKDDLAAFREAQEGRNDLTLTEEERQSHKDNYKALEVAKRRSASLIIPLANKEGFDLENPDQINEYFLDNLDTKLDEAEKEKDALKKAANEAEALEIDSEYERKAQAAKAKELIAIAEQVKAAAEEADRAYYEASRAAELAKEAEREAMNSLVTVTAAGNSTAISDAEQAAADAQAAAEAAEQAEADAQAEAEAEAAAQADAEADAAAGKDDDITTPVYVSAAPASAVDDTNVAVPAAIMLINNPVAIEVEEIVDELIFTESNVEDLLIGAGVAVGMVEVKTDGGAWQTLDQDVTNSLALGAYDEELEIRVTSNDAEPVIVEKTVEVVRVQTAAPITPEQLAMLLPVASTTPASSSNSGLLIIVVIAGFIALIVVLFLRKKKTQ
jgi:hypothetical protein